MIKITFFLISTVLILVIANPVPQAISVQTCPYQQNGYYNQPITIPVILQQPTSKNNLCNQPGVPQNQMQSQENPSNNNINQILVSKILSNPSLQKILDPNTKFYNQNGVEIKRQVPNTGVVPNVINNYFIVPPEFLNLNETSFKKDVSQPKQIIRSQNDRVGKAKGNRRNIQINANKRQDQPENSNSVTCENNEKRIEEGITPIHPEDSQTNKRKRNRKTNTSQSKTEIEIENDYIEDGERQRSRRKQRKRKKEKQNTDERSIEVIEDENNHSTKEQLIVENSNDQNNNAKKRRRKPRPETNNQKEYSEPDGLCSKKITDDNVPKLEKETKVVQENQENANPVKEIKVTETVLNDKSQLKDIEKPAENTEQWQEPLENRLTRNSKNETAAKDVRWNYAAAPNDIFRSFFPYMPYYPNGNFPLGYDQFFQSLQLPNFGRNDSDNVRRRKQKRNRKNQNNKNQQETQNSSNLNEHTELPAIKTETTAKPMATEIFNEQTKLNSTVQMESKSKPIEQVLEIPMEIPHKVSATRVDRIPESFEEYDIKPQLKEKDLKLKDFMITELGTEDVLPPIHRNGIINDYYPVFNDDNAYISSDEDYYVQNLENERYFYTTDRNLDTALNRDRRKHERVPNEDMQRHPKYSRNKDRHSFNTENDELKPRYTELEEQVTQKPLITDKTQVKTRKPIYESEEIQYRSPPILEFPDFRTKKIQKELIKSDIDNYDEVEVFFDDYADKSSSYSNVKTPQYNTRVKPNADVKRVRIPPRNTKPKMNNVETVFARSKVAKYGQVSPDSEEESSTPLLYYEDEPQYYSDGGTTYVVAKSLYQDDYW